MIKLYVLPSNPSSRKAKAKLIEWRQSFSLQNINTDPLSFDQLKEILSLTDNGVYDILANGKEMKMLEEEGVDLDAITLSEFHYYVTKFPRLLRAPLTIYKNQLIIGYNEDAYRRLMSRPLRVHLYIDSLEKARKEDERKELLGIPITVGHWGME